MRYLLRLLLGLPTPAGAQRQTSGRPQRSWGAWWDRHPRLLRLLAVITLTWILTYLGWRILFSWGHASLWVGVPLFVTELFGLWNLANLVWFSWRVPATLRPLAPAEVSTDIYVCTYNESETVLRATLIGCAAVNGPHTTYLLDDGHREEMRELAHELGAEYISRPDNSHAKAGNINYALPRTSGDLVLMLDADHVPLPGILDALTGYFRDPEIAVVQTPHDFYNHDSVQHYEVGRHEQSVFFSVTLPGKDRHGGVYWCGSAALIRREALLEVGGVATETIAEDFHTTIKLMRAGWQSRYHDEVLVQGLAPQDMPSYLLQRDRWARGNLAVFCTPESPLRAKELTPAQRLSYFASLTSYLAGPVRLLGLLTLTVTLWTGLLPLHITPLTLAVLWAPATMLSLLSGAALCRGYQGLADTSHFELCTAEIYARALRCIVRPGRTSFKVTPKDGVDHGGWEAVKLFRIVTVIALLITLGIALRIAGDIAGIQLLPGLPGMAVWVVPVIAGLELRRIARTLTLIHGHRQLRSEYRVPLSVAAGVATEQSNGDDENRFIGKLADVSGAGMRIMVPRELPVGSLAKVAFAIPTLGGTVEALQATVEVLSCRPAGDSWAVGTRTAQADEVSQRLILEYVHVISAIERLGLEEAAMVPSLPDASTIEAELELLTASSESARNVQMVAESTRLDKEGSQSIVSA